MSKKAQIILNGHINTAWLNQQIDHSLPIYVADGAYNSIHSLNLPITSISGDMDSINKKHNIPVLQHPDQSQTDFYKLLDTLCDQYQELVVFGASGKEMDHSIGNLLAAARFTNRVSITFLDEFQSLFVIDKYLVTPTNPNDTISLLPLPYCELTSYSGLTYPVGNSLALDGHYSLRNTATTNELIIKIKNGALAVFITKCAKSDLTLPS